MSVSADPSEFIWTQKYRPATIDDCVLPESIKSVAKGFVESGNLPSILMSGGPGIGKTTLAYAMCKEVGADVLFLNASSESGIDVFRNRITNFATSVSFSDAKKVVILDELDSNINISFQNALKSGIEAVSSNCSFLITCNIPTKIIEPIHSRTVPFKFKIDKADHDSLQVQFFRRVLKILDQEGIEYDKKVVALLIKKQFPDFRKTLYTFQKYSVVGKIDSGILLDVGEDAMNTLVAALKDKKFNTMRQWVADHSDMEPSEVINMFYRHGDKKLVQKSIPEFILMLGEYTNNVSRSINPEVTLVSFLTSLLTSSVEWQ